MGDGHIWIFEIRSVLTDRLQVHYMRSRDPTLSSSGSRKLSLDAYVAASGILQDPVSGGEGYR
jgi:hypothetical protein